MKAKNGYEIVQPVTAEVVITLVLRPQDVEVIRDRLIGYGLLNGAWSVIRDAADDLEQKGLIYGKEY